MANEIIRPTALPPRASPVASEVTVSDNGATVAGVTWTDGVNAAVPPASQPESEAGLINTKRMTPLTTKQAIDAQVPPKINSAIADLNLGSASQSQVSDFATAAQGDLADTAVQPSDLADVATSGDYEDLSNKPTARLIPAGGLTSQSLVKSSDADYATEWVTSAAATAVSYASQSLSVGQQAQARANIGLASIAEATNGPDDSAVTFSPYRNGAREEISRFHVDDTGRIKYLFMDVAAWEASHPGHTYPNSTGVNEFHFSCVEGPAADAGEVTVEFESLSGPLRVAIESPAEEKLFINFEHPLALYSMGLRADDSKLRLHSAGSLTGGTDLMTWDRTEDRVSVNTDTYVYGVNERFSVNGLGILSRTDGNALGVQRLGTDGGLVNFIQDGSLVGTITNSGGTVSYNSFCGSHWSQSDRDSSDILVGTVIETVDAMCEWSVEVWEEEVPANPTPKMRTATETKTRFEFRDGRAELVEDVVEVEIPVTERCPVYRDGAPVMKATPDGSEALPLYAVRTVYDGDATLRKVERRATYNPSKGIQNGGRLEPEQNLQLVKCKISDTPSSPNVYGVFKAVDEDGDIEVASIGAFVIRIGAGIAVRMGDLLESAGDGTARPQSDDIIRARTIGKVLGTSHSHDHPDGSYTVPVALYCG